MKPEIPLNYKNSKGTLKAPLNPPLTGSNDPGHKKHYYSSIM